MFDALLSRLRDPAHEARILSERLLGACANADQALALELLAQGASPAAKAPMGSTPLMFAARHDQRDLFLALCARPECDTRARDSRGRDALSWASARVGFSRASGAPLSDLFERLDESRFDLQARDDSGRHALDAALESYDEGACLFWLSRAPQDAIDEAMERQSMFCFFGPDGGGHGRALRLLARSQRLAMDRCAEPAARGSPSGPRRL